MKLSYLFLILLTACSTLPQNEDKIQEINKLSTRESVSTVSKEPVTADRDCVVFSRYVRMVAEIRDAGKPAKDVEKILVKKNEFPHAPIIREVYSRKDLSPELGEINAYSVCKKVTYSAMLVSLVKAETASFVGGPTKNNKAKEKK